MRSDEGRPVTAPLPVIVLGAGGHAAVVIDLLRALGREVRGCVAPEDGPASAMAPLLGGDDALDGVSADAVALALGVGSIGDSRVRRIVWERFRMRGFSFPALVHPTAALGSGVTLGDGAVVMMRAAVQTGVQIGEAAILNTACSVDHHARVGAFVHVAPGATLCGDVTIGDDAHVGPGAVVCQGVRVGAGAVLAAGAVVIRDVRAGCRMQGVPARERQP